MQDKSGLQFSFKEFIRADSGPAYRQEGFRGIDKIKHAPDLVWDLLVYEPRTVEEAKLGNLFMLGRIENIPKNKYKDFDFLLNLLISVIKREFYSNSTRPALEALEASLNKANLYLADFIEKGNIEWQGNLHFVCGVLSQNTLHVTKTGTPIIKLFRGTTISHIDNKFPTPKNLHPIKTFGNIVSGTIISGDKIIIGTKDILEVTPLNQLKELLKKSGHQTIEMLKRTIEYKKTVPPLICLIVEARTEAPEEITTCIIESTQTPQPTKKAKIIKISKVKPILKIIFIGTYRTMTFLIYIFKKILKPLNHRLKKTSFFSALSIKISNLYLNLIEISKIRQIYSNLRNRFLYFKNRQIKIIYQNNKPVFFVAFFLIILILILPFLTVQKINYQAKIKHFNELSAAIQEIQKNADIALIYQDKEKAKGLIQKTQPLVTDISEFLKKSPFKNNKYLISLVSNLQEKHQEQQDNINNVKRAKNLKEILDFSKSGFIVNPIGMNKATDYLYFFELESSILYKFNLNTEKQDLILIFISAKDNLRKMIALENGKIALFGQSGKIYLYDGNTNDHSDYSLDPAISIEKIKDLESFSSNLYILDNEQSNIIKYSLDQAKEGIIKGNSWLLEPTEELKQATSMTTDGSIYVLKTDGLIIKYFRGKKVETIKPLLEIPAVGENKIFTGNDFKNLYISDSKNKRLIVLNQKGELINQYVNDEFANLTDFLVTNDEKEVYLLCNKKVFKLDL